jgi:branched-chain amino acid transport system substrate-binding protein
MVGITAFSALAQTPGVRDTSILVGSCSALDGPARFLGNQTVLGATTYLHSINDDGGVFGRKVQLLAFDDGYDPDKAPACFKRVSREGVFALGFFVGTPTAKVYVPMAQEEKIPVVGLFTGAQMLYEPLKHYVINVRSPAGLGPFARNTIDVDGGLKEVMTARPQAVVLVGPYAPVAAIVKKAHAAGWRPLFLTVSFVGTEEFIKEAGPDAEGTIITQVVPPYDRTDYPTVALYRKLLGKYYPDTPPSFVSLEGFVDAMVLVEGLKRAGKDPTREKFITGIESIHEMNVGLGSKLAVKFGPADHKGFDEVYPTVVHNGQPVLLTDWTSVGK